jgi:2-polyprenyl-6-methoxyphenol hydroxylase-like FAD-dependent oxidoreductase
MSVKNVLIVGGGISGTVTAIALAQKGVRVTLIEISPRWHGVGHGITVQGNAMKAFRRIGALDRILKNAHPFSELRLCHADGHLISTVDTPRTGGPDLPPTMGALRSDLQTVLVDMIHELGIEVRLGTELDAFENTPDGVTATLSDGTIESYDLVVGADGIKSKTRALLNITHSKKPTGLGIWRIVTARTPEMDCASVYHHGPEYKAGYTPISKDLCYAYVLTDPVRPDNGLTDAQEVKRLLAGYHGDFDFIRENISATDLMSFQPIEWLFVDDQPWHVGRVIAIGDAVHACPPLIAQGAAQCCEDAVLLADYVTSDGELTELLEDYEQRRKARVRVVVDASLQLAEWELHPEQDGIDTAGLMSGALNALTQPA